MLGARYWQGRNLADPYLIGAVLFAVAGHLFLFWLSYQIFSYTIDDAYITFRYSKNLAAGFGPTYNPGLPPVEGYTTFLWMLLMALPHAGMETSLFIFLIALMVYIVTLGLLDSSRLLFWAPLVGLLIGLTRPEGNAISLLLLASEGAFGPRALGCLSPPIPFRLPSSVGCRERQPPNDS